MLDESRKLRMNGPDQFPHLLPMIAMAVAFVAESSPAFSQSLTFAAEPTGTLSKTFETALTGQGQAGRWEVIEDASADDVRARAPRKSTGKKSTMPSVERPPYRVMCIATAFLARISR